MKRILLFLLTNLAIILVLSFVINITGANRFLEGSGINVGTLLMFSLFIGFFGSITSLLASRKMAKYSTGAKVITEPKTSEEGWLVETVRSLASRANLPMPEVAIYEGSPNAFATGPSKSKSLVAVSTGLLDSMNHPQVEAVLAHEMSHVANGDMVTLTLIQGVVNTFVVFLSKLIAFVADRFVQGDNRDSRSGGGIYYLCDFIFQMVFGVLASIIVMFFSRQREYRADAGAGKLLGNNERMVDALKALANITKSSLPKSMATSGIAGSKSLTRLFASHPTIEERIAALRSGQNINNL